MIEEALTTMGDAASRPGHSPARRGTRYADAGLSLLLMAIVGMMIVPLPTPLLDVLIASNVALGLLMLLIAMTVGEGLALSAMPTILLISTLYRLALNVSSTRLILLQADAGEVIRSFGDFVVRGDYIVGGVVFAILVLIQYVVVARGSERIAEVGARFSLDAMPGKQMAIDADLRAGALTPEAARGRRRELDRENQFYGAMDGAMKFVKGDAIAGIVITLINLGAGMAIGVGVRDLPMLESARVYGLLTIGDGLVSQIPSLLTSTSAGLVVTRVASHEGPSSLGHEIGRQLFGQPHVLGLGAVFLAGLAVLPGLPAAPFGLLALVFGALAYGLSRRSGAQEPEELAELPEDEPARLALFLDAERWAPDSGTALRNALTEVRVRLERELGVPVPAIAVRKAPSPIAEGFRLALDEAPLPIPAPAAQSQRPLDLEELARRVEAGLRRHAGELVGIQETQHLLDRLEATTPALVHQVVPKIVGLGPLTQLLKRLLEEGVSVRPLRQVLEALAAQPVPEGDMHAQLEAIRLRVRRRVTEPHLKQGRLRVHPLAPAIEDAVRDAIVRDSQGRFLALAPEEADDILQAVGRLREREGEVVLVTQPDVRPFVRELVASNASSVAVLSYPELAELPQVERCTPLTIGR